MIYFLPTTVYDTSKAESLYGYSVPWMRVLTIHRAEATIAKFINQIHINSTIITISTHF